MFLKLALTFVALSICSSSCLALDYYAAIAYSPRTTQYGYCYGKTSRNAAQATAIANSGAYDARVVVTSRNAWCALARSSQGNGWGSGWATTKSGAMSYALRNCPNYGGKRIAVIIFSGRP
jgi:hypothetical protein